LTTWTAGPVHMRTVATSIPLTWALFLTVTLCSIYYVHIYLIYSRMDTTAQIQYQWIYEKGYYSVRFAFPFGWPLWPS